MQFKIYFSSGLEIFKKFKFLLDLFMVSVQFSQGYRKPFREDSLIAMPPQNFWYLFDPSQKDERLRKSWSSPMVLSAIPLNAEFSVSIFESKHHNPINLFVP